MIRKSLKPILVIDNRELFPPVGGHGDIVHQVKTADPESLDPSKFAAVFVHDDNQPELNWVRRNAATHFNGIYFKFTGRRGQFDNVTCHRGAYKLPRWVLAERFVDFLDDYCARGIVDTETAKIFEK